MATLAIQKQKQTTKRVSPNVLPCQIHHDGPLELSPRHWQPVSDEGTTTVHFRGRRLLGKIVQLPESHEGVVLKITADKTATSNDIWNDNTCDTEDPQEAEEIHIAEELASFDRMVVWNHDSVPESTEDQYVKGIQEWIGMAEAIHNS